MQSEISTRAEGLSPAFTAATDKLFSFHFVLVFWCSASAPGRASRRCPRSDIIRIFPSLPSAAWLDSIVSFQDCCAESFEKKRLPSWTHKFRSDNHRFALESETRGNKDTYNEMYEMVVGSVVSSNWYLIRANRSAYRHDRGRGKRKQRKHHSQNGHPVLFRRDLRRDLNSTRRVAADYIDSANEIGVLNGSHWQRSNWMNIVITEVEVYSTK